MQKYISLLLVILILMPSLLIAPPPKTAEAQFTDFVAATLSAIGNALAAGAKFAINQIKDIDWKKIAKDALADARKIISLKVQIQMSTSIVNWANSGFHGAPLFLENPKSFFNDISKTKIKDLMQVMGYDSVRFPFAKDYILGVFDSYGRTLQNNAD